MKPFVINNKFIPRGTIILPGDKSITHRAIILSALSQGKTLISNFPIHDDSLATLNAFRALGVRIRRSGNKVLIFGLPRQGLRQPLKPIFVNNSGTSLRLLLGVLAGQPFRVKLNAAKYLARRPMARVNEPLRLMGAKISAKNKGHEEFAPILITGGRLKGITYRLPVASAQVKSALLLAGLFARGKTRIIEPEKTRDHTERMLKLFGVRFSIKKKNIILEPPKKLTTPGKVHIPGDISSAAFFMVLAALVPGAKVIIRQVSLNPGRAGIIPVLKRMRAKIKVKQNRQAKGGEPLGDILISASHLKGTLIYSSEIPSLIDELPILMVAACFAQGRTIIKGAGELRVKEADRIHSMLVNLKKMGAKISAIKSAGGENIVINGRSALKGARLASFGDHRTAMSLAVAALAAEGRSVIDDISCVNKSFPGFLNTLKSLKKG